MKIYLLMYAISIAVDKLPKPQHSFNIYSFYYVVVSNASFQLVTQPTGTFSLSNFP